MEIYVKRFLELLMLENEKHNLVSRKSTPADLEQHVKDSLQIMQWVSLSNQRVVDIGSGAGFPGMILAMAQPDCQMTLVESDLKKSAFLQSVKEKLDLPNVCIIRTRAETLAQDSMHRGQYDLCTSRAVAALRVMLEYGLPLINLDGKILLWKGRRYREEINEAQKALNVLGGAIETIHKYKLIDDNDRAIVVVKKVHPTPDQYPRKVGAPTKKPL